MDHEQEPTKMNIPYLFLPLTEKEEEQLVAMQDFMQQHRTELPLMTVKAMLHNIAIQIQGMIDIWQKDIVKQIEKKEGPVKEEDEGQITNMLLAESIAFLLANKAYVSNKDDILKNAAMLLSLLYPPPGKETK